MYHPQGSIVIMKLKIGYVVEVNGSREDQEDNMNGRFAFGSFSEVVSFLNDQFDEQAMLISWNANIGENRERDIAFSINR